MLPVLRGFGVDPAVALAEAGLARDDFGGIDNMIPFSATGRFLQRCVEATWCSHFGILVGQRGSLDHLGLVGRLMANAPSLLDAIIDLVANQHRYVRGSVVHLLVKGDTSFWGYSVHQPYVQAVDQINDVAIAWGFSLMRAICDVAPEAVRLPRKAPADAVPYQSYYGMTPRFDAELAALVFPAELLRQPLPKADARLRQMLEAEVTGYWAIAEPDVPSQVVRLLRARVLSGDVTEEAIASSLSMHSRTLKRRLRIASTSFRKLVNETRFEIARQLLVGTRIPITGIALALQYADSSGFTRAFRARAGISPSAWRDRSPADLN